MTRRALLSIKPTLVAALCAAMTGTVAHADDTEIFYSRSSDDPSERPNVLFILDTSGSMNTRDQGTLTRLDVLKSAMTEILEESTNINVGLMRLNGSRGGGAVIQPIIGLEEPVCEGDCGTVHLTKSIENSMDDGFENKGGVVDLTQSAIVLASEADASESGTSDGRAMLRFADLDVPQGARIDYAKLRFQLDANGAAAGTVNLRAEASDDAAPFVELDYNLSSRSMTLSQTNWNIEATGGNETLTSGSFAPVLQEIVNREGWCGGNAVAIALVGEDLGKFWSHEGQASDRQPAALEIGYTPGQSIDGAHGCQRSSAVSSVTSSIDDAVDRGYYSWRRGYMIYNDSTIYLPALSGSNATAGLRFKNVEIPRGADITDAYIEFVPNETTRSTSTIAIRAVNSGNAPEFGNNSRTRLNALPTGSALNWTVPVDAPRNMKVRTTNISSIIKPVINRSDWEAGNAIALRLDALSSSRGFNFKTVDRSAADAPKLIVRFNDNSAQSHGQTGREILLQEISALQAYHGTPLVEAYYEAARYIRGEGIDYGTSRGIVRRNDSYSRVHRVSHPQSYTGGTVWRDPRCTDDNLNSSYCITERIDSNPVYISPYTDACQPTQIVFLSDGEASSNDATSKVKELIGKSSCTSYDSNGYESCGRELANWLFENDQSRYYPGRQSITTHTIGFATEHAFLRDIAKEGGGEYYTANNVEELVNSFRSILNAVQGVDTSFVGPTVTVSQFNRLTHSDEIYFALFKPYSLPRWPGNLKRYRVGTAADGNTAILDSNGNRAIDEATGFFADDSRSFWTAGSVTDGNLVNLGGAASRLAALQSRNVYTHIGLIPSNGVELVQSANSLDISNTAITPSILGLVDTGWRDLATERDKIVQWAQGIDVRDEDGDGNTLERHGHMGDPLHANPQIVSYADSSKADGFHSIIFTANNGGFLHAIDTISGDEIYSFVPQELLPRVAEDYYNRAGTMHGYGLDGNISVWHDDKNNDMRIDANERAILYVGMRRGGQHYYAIDISRKSHPKLLWSIAGGSEGDQGFEELGQTWSTMVPTSMYIGGEKHNVLVFSAGYDERQDAVQGDDTILRGTDEAGRGFYIVDAVNGDLLWSVLGNESSGMNASAKGRTYVSEMKYAITANVRVVDSNKDGLADSFFLADLGGQIWRFDVTQYHEGGELFNGGRIATLGSDLSREKNRRFYYEPEVAYISIEGNLAYAVTVGSGWRAHPLDMTTSDRYYMLISEGVHGMPQGYGRLIDEDTPALGYRPLTDDDLVKARDNTKGMPKYGWYFDFSDSGEKVLGSSIAFNGKVFFTTYLPRQEVAGCFAAVGGGRLYALDLYTGQAAIDFNNDGAVGATEYADNLAHGGIPPDVNILVVDTGLDAADGVGSGLQVNATAGGEMYTLDSEKLVRSTYWIDAGRSED